MQYDFFLTHGSSLLKTECNRKRWDLHGLKRREAIAKFDGGILLRELEERTGILERFAGCFTDRLAADRLEHKVLDLVKQREFGLCLGYEDLNDAERLLVDPAVRHEVGGRSALTDKQAASTSKVGRRETEILGIGSNLKKLMENSTRTTSTKARRVGLAGQLFWAVRTQKSWLRGRQCQKVTTQLMREGAACYYRDTASRHAVSVRHFTGALKEPFMTCESYPSSELRPAQETLVHRGCRWRSGFAVGRIDDLGVAAKHGLQCSKVLPSFGGRILVRWRRKS